MVIEFDPRLQECIERLVKEGYYESPKQLVEAAVSRLLLDDDPELMNEDVLAAIEESEAQIERGQVHDWQDIRDELRRKYLGA